MRYSGIPNGRHCDGTILKQLDYQEVLFFRGLKLAKSKLFGTLETVSCLSRCPYFRESTFSGSTVHSHFF